MASNRTIIAEVDFRELESAIALATRDHRLAAASAMNHELGKERTQTARKIAADLRLPYRVVRRRMKLRRATSNALVAQLGMITNPIPVIAIALDAKKSEQGRVRTKGKGADRGSYLMAYGGRSYRAAFIARGTKNKEMVFFRKGKPRLPLEAPHVETKEACDRALQGALERASARVGKTMANELAWRLDRRAGGNPVMERHERARMEAGADR